MQATMKRFSVVLEDTLHQRVLDAANRRGHHGAKTYVVRKALEIFVELDEGFIDKAQAVLKEIRQGGEIPK